MISIPPIVTKINMAVRNRLFEGYDCFTVMDAISADFNDMLNKILLMGRLTRDPELQLHSLGVNPVTTQLEKHEIIHRYVHFITFFNHKLNFTDNFDRMVVIKSLENRGHYGKYA